MLCLEYLLLEYHLQQDAREDILPQVEELYQTEVQTILTHKDPQVESKVEQQDRQEGTKKLGFPSFPSYIYMLIFNGYENIKSRSMGSNLRTPLY